MKIVFMGTPDFAVPCLEALVENNYDVTAVFTQPDRPKGRGKKVSMSPVKEKALDFEIPVYQPQRLKEASMIELLYGMEPDVIVVVAYGQILPKAILDIPALGCINVHASLLPKYRGAGPINWAIINGEKETGITTMYMDVGLDTGDMILKEKVTIGEEETAGELHDRLSILGAKVLIKTLNDLAQGNIQRVPQNDDKATYAPMLTKTLGKIDWKNSAETLKNLIRGTIPWPTAYTIYKGNMMKVWKARVIPKAHSDIPGRILEVTQEGIFVATGQDILLLEEIQFSGKKKLRVKEYLVGNNIDVGTILDE